MQAGNLLCALRDECSNFFGMLHRLRAVLLFAPLLVMGFANDQVIEVAREYLSSDPHIPDRFDFVRITLLVTTGLMLLFVGFILERLRQGESRYSFGRRLAIGMVVFMAVLPAVYFGAELDSGPTGLVVSHYSAWNTSVSSILLFGSICSLLFAVLPPVIIAPISYAWRALRLRWIFFGCVVLALTAYLILCLLPLLISEETLFSFIRAASDRLGVFPFIGLFLLALFSVVALSTLLFDTWRIPALSLLVLMMIAFSAMGLNSDFNARPLGSQDKEMKPRPIAGAFREWLANRRDYAQHRAANPSRPYPVYLVAMAGGGAYAGFHASYFLTRLFESCPKLRHHTFAISAVSGGALGAALVTTEASQRPTGSEPGVLGDALNCNSDPGLDAAGPAARKIEEFFTLDHVTFLIWARLYPDMFRRLFWFEAPGMVSDTLFEKWFNTAWNSIATDSKALRLSDSVYSYWRPDGDAPAVFFNITNTQTGRAEAVSPLHFPRNLPTRKNIDMRLITAAGLSFRFPILTSPGTFPRNTSIPAQGFDAVTNYDTLDTGATYVDGGYYENSGLYVLDRVKTELERSAGDLNIEVRLISFTASPNQETLRSSDGGEGSLLAPINALFAARKQRGIDEWELFLRRHGNFDAHLSLYQDRFHHHLPLGWTLSRQSIAFIKRHFGVPSDCAYTERFWEMMLNDFEGARTFFADRFPPEDYGIGLPGLRPRDLDVKDTGRLSKLDMMSQRIYMGCQMTKIFGDLSR